MPKFVAALRNPKEPVNLRGHLSQEEVEVQVEVGEEGELQVMGAITKFLVRRHKSLSHLIPKQLQCKIHI